MTKRITKTLIAVALIVLLTVTGQAAMPRTCITTPKTTTFQKA